ncbi:hypothetical protein Fmac_031146 [Flemingia macrophylla]|uniref:Neprosin PEP catalytic domain-containing protein n=1 Tax=Flemingia macrophylla TaxID=520843 RepID=A0ABD1L2H0_9FABA
MRRMMVSDCESTMGKRLLAAFTSTTSGLSNKRLNYILRVSETTNFVDPKSKHTEFGYIVDCIDINKQPAFDHPLLKNHKLQRKPSVQKSFRKTNVKNSRAESIFGLHKVQCPTGTVPIRRVTKEGLIRSKLFNNHILIHGAPGYHYAEVYLKRQCSPFYGASGSNSVYNPKVNRNDQYTTSLIRIQNGPVQAADELAFGWHRSVLKQKGCYNILCPGFVQTHQGFYLGGRVENISTPGGLTFEYHIAIFRDSKTKNWWISLGDENIGYFPGTLFSNMSSTDYVGWGGETITPAGTPSPQMGSGYFPDGKLTRTGYFKNVAILDELMHSYPASVSCAVNFNDIPNCFKAAYHSDLGDPNIISLEFGGPGGNCGD